MGQSRSDKAGDAARSVASNPYVRRLIEDEELRDNIRVAFEAAKDAYARMSNGKGPAKSLLDDKKVHRDLQEAARSFKEAADGIRGRSAAAEASASARRCWSAIIGAALVLILCEDARKVVLDKLFGAEEEFEYTSTTTPTPTETVADTPTGSTSS